MSGSVHQRAAGRHAAVSGHALDVVDRTIDASLAAATDHDDMPLVFRDGPFRYFFYSNEGHPRESVHVHVRGGGGEAKIVLYPVPRVVRSAGLNSGILRALTRVVEQNLDTIQEAWDDHFC